MRRFRFRRRSFGRTVRRARPIIRAATGITLAKRIILDNITIADTASVSYDTPTVIDLLECTEAQDEEAESNGSTIADCPLYSRITSMKLNLILEAAAAGKMRWMLVKRPDGETNLATTSLIDATFHGSDDTINARELRAQTLAKGIAFVSPDRLGSRLNVYVKKSAWARASPMREGDKITFIIAKESAGTTGTISGFGTIWVKANT